MSALEILLQNGQLLLAGQLLNTASEQGFVTSTQVVGGVADSIDRMIYNGHVTHSIDCMFLHQPFKLSAIFFDGKLWHQQVGLVPLYGVVHQKGDTVSYDELVNNIDSLRQLLADKLNVTPSQTDNHQYIYQFDWGQITCGGSLKSPSLAIGIRYQHR